jgi:hypothetical protein
VSWLAFPRGRCRAGAVMAEQLGSLRGAEAVACDSPRVVVGGGAGLYAQLDEIIIEYSDLADDHFHQGVMPLLDHLSGRELASLVGADRRTIDRIRKGQSPRPEMRQALTQLAMRLTRLDL